MSPARPPLRRTGPGGLLLIAFGLLAMVPAFAAPAAGEQVDFNRDIRRILSDNCIRCHGPDAKERKGSKATHGGLRLDTREGATVAIDDYFAIVPGHPEKSEVYARIITEDENDMMPPADSGKKLTARDKALVKAWIEQGAPYAKHWSYVVPVRPALPAVSNPKWPVTPIDRFILARLDQEKLPPSPEADRLTLARRVALDLTGLPPSPEEVKRFEADRAPDAYVRYVDRLLAQEAFGEHWARLWLDQARYADSAGYADDPSRTIWAYRDYLIRSFNSNKPFDRFTVEQIAGDLLPNPTEEQQIATAFHRNTSTNSEGGTVDEEFRNAAVIDRVNTTMTVWMGSTMACAQCHTHKYDPFTQEDYFRLFAILNNTADEDRKDEAPVLSLYTPEQKQQRKILETELAALGETLRTRTPELLAGQPAWEASLRPALTWSPLGPADMKSKAGAAMTTAEDGTVQIERKGEMDTYTFTFDASAPGSVSGGESLPLTALRLETVPAAAGSSKGAGHGDDGAFILTRVTAELLPAAGNGKAEPVRLESAYADFTQEGFAADSVLNAKAGKEKGWAVGPQLDRSHTLTLLPETPIALKAGTRLRVTLEQQSKKKFHTLAQLRLSAASDARVGEITRTPAAIFALLQTPPAQRSDAQRETLTAHYLTVAPGLASPRQRFAAASKELELLKPYTTVPVMGELAGAKRRVTHIQRRGNYLDLDKEVTPGTPGALNALPSGAPADRLGLAQWLVDPKNPLMSRVIANLFWESIFGAGLVRTSEDFGSQGDPPSHPELLDWLAVEFRESGWDVKHLLKLMVTSATYRQSSRLTPEALMRDSDNRLLAHGPRFRLSAEMIRDQALFVSGLLSHKLYGAPVNPPQPKMGVTAAFGATVDWENSTGEDRYRRGLYTTWRRSNPYPSMTTFDAPSREVCTVRRERSNTPLQALVTLNDPVYLEAAQSLARRIAAGEGTPADKLRLGFRLCLVREPREKESAELLALYTKSHDRFAADREQAMALATKPLGPVPAGADVVDLAAWTVVGNVLLNLDELLMKP
jgi:hypothetical protein